MRILAVEDEALIALVLEQALSCAGHQVLGPAASIEEALQLIDDEAPPELALVNINLRDRDDGISLARILHTRHGVPVLFLSAQTDQARASRDVAWGVISKPYEPETVLSAVEALGELKRGRQPASLPSGLELF